MSIYRFFFLNKKIYYSIIFSICFSIVSCIVVYFFFYPRYRLGYSETYVSKYEWDSAFPGFNDYPAYLYYKRRENNYYADAYLLFSYNLHLSYMGHQISEPSEQELLQRIQQACIDESDASLIKKTLPKFRELWRNMLESDEGPSHKRLNLARALLPLYFSYYTNAPLYHTNIVSEEEFRLVSEYIKRNDVDYRKRLRDPLQWREADLTPLGYIPLLRNWISLNIGAELITNMDLYEQLSAEYENNIFNKN